MDANNMNNQLPVSAMKVVPAGTQVATEIVAVVKDSGDIVGYKLSDGKIVFKDEALKMARNGELKNIGISENQGTEYLKSLPDNDMNNNLSSLPSIPMPTLSN